MANDKKKKPRPWDKSDEDIPDVIWGGHQNAFHLPGTGGGVIDPASAIPLPSMERPFSGPARILPHSL